MAKRHKSKRKPETALAKRTPDSELAQASAWGADMATPVRPGAPTIPRLPGPDAAAWDVGDWWNTVWLPRRETERLSTFSVLKGLAGSNDLVQSCIAEVQDFMAGIDWAFVARRSDTSEDPLVQNLIQQLERFWLEPNPIDGLDFRAWMKSVIWEILVTDALTIEPIRDRLGNVVAFGQVDGSTIKPLLDERARRPRPPKPAFQQTLKGITSAWFSADELVYYPTRRVPDSPYGVSAVEQVITTVMTGSSRWTRRLEYYTNDTTPSAWFEVPEGATPKQAREWAALLNDVIAATGAERWRLKPVPRGANIQRLIEPTWSREEDEWIARVLCKAFHVNPLPYVAMMNRATSETMETIQQDSGVQPMRATIEGLIDRLVTVAWGADVANLVRFQFVTDKTDVSLARAQTLEVYQRNGWMKPWEIREGILGLDPDDDVSALPAGYTPGAPAAASGADFPGLGLPSPSSAPSDDAPAPAAADDDETTLNELTLGMERAKRIGDQALVDSLRTKIAELLGVPPFPPMPVQSDVEDEIRLDRETEDASPPPEPPADFGKSIVLPRRVGTQDEQLEEVDRWRRVSKRYGLDSRRALEFRTEVLPATIESLIRSGLASAGDRATGTTPGQVFEVAKARVREQMSPTIRRTLGRIQSAALALLEQSKDEIIAEAVAEARALGAPETAQDVEP